jgi:hypothetical protein
MALAAVPATAQALKRLASGSIPSRAEIIALRPGTASSAARPPAGSAFSGRTTPNTRPSDRDDAGHDPSPRLRRRHVLAAEMPIYQARYTSDSR